MVVDNSFGDEAFPLECRKHFLSEFCKHVDRNVILVNAGVHFAVECVPKLCGLTNKPPSRTSPITSVNVLDST